MTTTPDDTAAAAAPVAEDDDVAADASEEAAPADLAAAAARVVTDAATGTCTPAAADEDDNMITESQLGDRDVVFGIVLPARALKANLFMGDLVRLHRIVHHLKQNIHPGGADADAATGTTATSAPDAATAIANTTLTTEEADAVAPVIADQIYTSLAHGKRYELAGVKDVPKPFLSGSGRFLEQQLTKEGEASSAAADEKDTQAADADAVKKTYKIMQPEAAKQKLIQFVTAEFAKPLGVVLSDIPYKDLGDAMSKHAAKHPESSGSGVASKAFEDASAPISADPKDAVLVPVRPQYLMLADGSAAADASSAGGAGSMHTHTYPADTHTANPLQPHEHHHHHHHGDKLYESQGGNRAIFNLASQLVTAYTTNSDKRVEAALAILKGLSEAEVIEEDKDTKTTTVVASNASRFLVRDVTVVDKPDAGNTGTTVPTMGDKQVEHQVEWSILSPHQAAEFSLGFCFEVFLEKGIHLLPPPNAETHLLHRPLGSSMSASLLSPNGTAAADTAVVAVGNTAVTVTTDADVLFGRGGMTNSHPGNRRFRDIIALHRPDYIRAIKMDKPAVARKIVHAIRHGNPPGRFLKKAEDGKWYDVGDRNAAEKTSQGLRERSNAEKRQRANLREALRVRREDMDDGTGAATAVDGQEPAPKKTKITSAELAAAGAANPILNYVGTNLAVPLSLGMKDQPKNTVKKPTGQHASDLHTEGLPPNAVDEDGNVLVTDYDILCGRGGLTNHHKGNKRFRDIVALHRPDYVRAPKIQKPSVARVIVRAIRNGDPPGRFLRKDDKTGAWYDIGDKKAAEKTSQALREKTDEERDRIKREGGSFINDATGANKAAPTAATLLTPAMLATAHNAAVTGAVAAAASVVAGTATPDAAVKADVVNTEDDVDDDKSAPAVVDDVKLPVVDPAVAQAVEAAAERAVEEEASSMAV